VEVITLAIIRERDRKVLEKHFAENLRAEVKVTLFTQAASRIIVPGELECPACEETRALLEEVAQVNDKIKLEIHDFRAEKEVASQRGVDKIPAILLQGKKPDSVRFFGIPSGYEFTTLVEDLIDVSRGETALSTETKQALSALTQEVHIQVFVTPT